MTVTKHRPTNSLGNARTWACYYYTVGCIQSGAEFRLESVLRSQDDLYYLEQAAKVQVLAMSTGAPLALVDEDVCKSVKTFGSIFAQQG